MPIIGVDECDRMYHNDSDSDSETETVPKGYRLIYEDMICAGFPEGKKDSCQVRMVESSISNEEYIQDVCIFGWSVKNT